MILGRKKQVPSIREKVIGYKKVFGSEEGKEVLFDLINKYHVLNPITSDSEMKAARQEGQREVVLWIMQNAYMDLTHLDKVLRGEL